MGFCGAPQLQRTAPQSSSAWIFCVKLFQQISPLSTKDFAPIHELAGAGSCQYSMNQLISTLCLYCNMDTANIAQYFNTPQTHTLTVCTTDTLYSGDKDVFQHNI